MLLLLNYSSVCAENSKLMLFGRANFINKEKNILRNACSDMFQLFSYLQYE